HQRVRLVAGEAEHHALVAGAADVDALGDVGRLGVQLAEHLAGVGGEADARVHVADLADGVADDAVDRGPAEVGPGGDLAGHPGEVGRGQGFAGPPARRVGRQAVVEDGVADLVGHLVGVAHRDGFAGEQVAVFAHWTGPQSGVIGGPEYAWQSGSGL